MTELTRTSTGSATGRTFRPRVDMIARQLNTRENQDGVSDDGATS